MGPKHSEGAPLLPRRRLPKTSRVHVTDKGGRLYVNVELPGISANEIDVRISNSLLDLCAKNETRTTHAAMHRKYPFDEIIGNSPSLTACLEMLQEAAATDASVLLCGETGTGKELFARAIHKHSARAQGNFVPIDCTVLPESIVGSLLFGYEKGAFTDAEVSYTGLIRQAHCGTLFLDEVGELSMPLQKAFLRVLHEQRFRPIGHDKGVESDFRLVAATNRDLRQSVAKGQFRQDLLYRLQSYLITLPSLRHRSEDIHSLSCYHLDRLCLRHGFCPKQLSPEFTRTLSLYPWPGNVRELINVLEQTLFTAQHETTLFAKHLPQHIRIEVAKASLTTSHSDHSSRSSGSTKPLPCLQDFRSGVYHKVEQQYLSSLVQQSGHNVLHACTLSGLSRSRLYSLLKKHQIVFH